MTGAEAALRGLRAGLRRLHDDAGGPDTRELARRINERLKPEEAIGPSTAHTVLYCRVLPSWEQVESLARALEADAGPLRPVWEAAYEASPERAVADALYRPLGGDPLTGRGPVPREAESRLWDPAVGAYRIVRGGCISDCGEVDALAFHPGGGLLATADLRGTVRLWDPATRLPATGPLTGHTGAVTRLLFHPRGRLLVSAGEDGTARVWDPATGDLVGAPFTRHESGIADLAFHPGGRLLATAGEDGTIWLWDPETGEPADGPLACHTERLWALAFHPGGGLLTAGSDGGEPGALVRLRDPATGETATRVLDGQTGSVAGALFNPDADRLAVLANDSSRPYAARTVRLWETGTGRPAAEPFVSPARNVRALAFHPDGGLLAVGGWHVSSLPARVQVWDPATGAHRSPESGALDQPSDNVWALAFHPDGHLLATGMEHRGETWLWRTAEPVGTPLVHRTSRVHTAAFHPGGGLLATADHRGPVRFWDPATGGSRDVPGSREALGAAFHPEGRLYAAVEKDGTGGGTVRLRDLATGDPVGAPLPGHELTEHVSLAFHPGGRLLAATDYTRSDHTGMVWLWDPFTGELPHVLPVGRARRLAFHPGGGLLAVAGTGVTLWDPFTGEPVRDPLTGPRSRYGEETVAAFSPDGRLLATAPGYSEDGVWLWDPSTGERVGEPLAVREGHSVTDAAFHPGGGLLAVGYGDGEVWLWDPSTGERLGTPLTGHGRQINALAFHPDGRLLASAGDDGTARLWLRAV